MSPEIKVLFDLGNITQNRKEGSGWDTLGHSEFICCHWYLAYVKTKGQLISKCLWCHRLDKKNDDIFSRISALASKKWLNQKLYYTNYIK